MCLHSTLFHSMIFKTIKDDLGNLKLSINSDIKDLFNGNFFKKQSILSDDDIKALKAYNAEIGRGVSPVTAYYRTMQEASDAAVNMAKSAGDTTVNLEEIPKVSKAASLGMELLANIGNKIANVLIEKGIQFFAKAIDNNGNSVKKLEQTISRLDEKISKYDSNIDSINNKLAENKERINEILALENPTYVDEQDLKKLREQNSLLKNNKEYYEKAKSKEQSEKIEALDKQYYMEFETNQATYAKKTSGIKNFMKNVLSSGLYTYFQFDNASNSMTKEERMYEDIAFLDELKKSKDNGSFGSADLVTTNGYNFTYPKETLDSDEKAAKKRLQENLDYFNEQLLKLQEDDPDLESDYANKLINHIEELTRILDFDSWKNLSMDKIISDPDIHDSINELSYKIGTNKYSSYNDILADEDYSGIIKRIALKYYGKADDESLKNAAKELYTAILGKINSGDIELDNIDSSKFTLSDIFSIKDSDNNLTDFGKISEELDNIQNGYKTLRSAFDEYNQNGTLSLDSLQAIMGLGDDWLGFIDEETGALKLDEEALTRLTLSRINDLKVQAQNNMINNVLNLKGEAEAKDYLTSTNYAYADSIEALTLAQAKYHLDNLVQSGDMNESTANSVMGQLTSDYNKVENMFSSMIANGSLDDLIGIGSDSDSSAASSASSDIIDFAEQRLNKLNKLIDTAKENIDQLEGSFSKNTAIDGLVNVDKSKLDTLQSVSDLYQQMADKYFAQIPEAYRELAKNGGINITEFIGDGNSDITEAIENYQSWADKVDDVNSEILELQQTLKDLQVDKFNNIKEDFDTIYDSVDKNKSKISNVIDLLETQGEAVGKGLYEELISETGLQLDALKEERTRLTDQLSSALENGIEHGSDEWFEMYNTIQEVDSSIIECSKDIEDFQNSMDELHWNTLTKIEDAFSKISDEISDIASLLENDKVFENGSFTAEAVSQIGLYAQQYELARNQIKKYSEEIDYLNAEYAKGSISIDDYYDRLAELQDAQWSAVSLSEQAKDSIIELNKTRIDEEIEGINEETNAYEELIDKQKEALQSEKALNDYKKSIAAKEKEIAELKRQINARMGSEDASTIAERESLEAELVNLTGELEDLKYEHSIEVRENALDRELEDFQTEQDNRIKILEESLKNEDALLADSILEAKNRADEISATLQLLEMEQGIKITECIINPWTQGSSAIAGYGQQLSSYTSIFTGNLMQIQTGILGVQNQADSMSFSIMSAFGISNANVVNTISVVRSYLDNASWYAMNLYNQLNNALNSGYGTGAIDSIYNLIDALDDAVKNLKDKEKDLDQDFHLYQLVYDYGAGHEVALTGILDIAKVKQAYSEYSGDPHVEIKQIYAKGGVISTKGWFDPFARELGEDVSVYAKEGERILTPAQNELFEKFVDNLPYITPDIPDFVNRLPQLPVPPENMAPVINIDAGITVEGNIDKDFTKQFESMQNKLVSNTTQKIAQSLQKLGYRSNCCRPL